MIIIGRFTFVLYIKKERKRRKGNETDYPDTML